MKLMKRISLFLFTAGLMFGAGSYATLKAEQFFYPNKYEREKDEITYNNVHENRNEDLTGEVSNTSSTSSDAVDEKPVIEAAMEEIPVITADTVYLVGKINLSDGTIEEGEEAVPVKYIGLDRSSLLKELEEYNKNPPLSELKNGFTNIELTAFSKDRVVICKYYETEPEEEGFYLMVADHFVIVYKEDKKTIYMNTDILLESLGSQLQEEIIAGKYVENEQELYNFLESYSS
ncbi:MAG: hypothetical protein J1E98_09435 [Lachnospiraceae bacterium]|nr:hypothetical protein [Lachnospiraceae bacterium]